MAKETSKTWNTGLPTVVVSRKARWMNKVNLFLVVAPLVVKWGVTLEIAFKIISLNVCGFCDKPGEIIPSSTELAALIVFALSISYPIGMMASRLVRFYLFSIGLMKMKRDSALGHGMFEAVKLFKHDVINESHQNQTLLATEAILKVGINELDSILNDLSKEDKPSPMLQWRLIVWSEKFGDVANSICLKDFDEYKKMRKESGWWANHLLPRHRNGEWNENIRQPILEALPFADPDEGARLSAFIVEAATIDENNMSADDKLQFMAMSIQAREIANNIQAAQAIVQVHKEAMENEIISVQNALILQNTKNSLVNIQRILSEDSDDRLLVSAAIEPILLAHLS